MDIVRLVGIISIIWGHCLYDWERSSFHTQAFPDYLKLILLELGRVGTVCFFLLSGYFMNDRLRSLTVMSYLRSRFSSVILPWFIYLSLYVLLETSNRLSIHDLSNPSKVISLFKSLYLVFIFHGAYWFVPAALICGSAMIAINKYIDRSWLGSTLLTITIFYSINLYANWIDVNHTKAVAGYALFTWLGITLRRKENQIFSYIQRIHWATILILGVAFFTAACIESMYLKQLGGKDPFASIRASNILFSLILFVALLKKMNYGVLAALKTRKYVYGLYLIHSIVISQLWRMSSLWVMHGDKGFSQDLTMHVCIFLFTMLISFGILIGLKYLRLLLDVGMRTDRSPTFWRLITGKLIDSVTLRM